MGLPLEQWRGGEADGKDAPAPAGCRTPGGAQAAGGDCPAAPRKRRAPAGVVAQQRRRDYYAGADVEAFFAAHNL
ncbi:hypothetical protein GQ55_9G463100 [Panicum hallii var. hallii]|jgi:hypothetical protein|uniref:Uncharacterized protein n=2 Tax=Panicum hallii TaxID=206008 RepID=A0A2T7CC88_9POAL|nr:uncharacterized protein LOC112873298 [Panicum hallii]PAN49475.1 hypothetical protein PAHAL_9G451700 [Panicum hallii]PUZ40945.1 hypothetical protein GQ55_9G463100 [Panicum hallii var. hallii]